LIYGSFLDNSSGDPMENANTFLMNANINKSNVKSHLFIFRFRKTFVDSSSYTFHFLEFLITFVHMWVIQAILKSY